MSKTWLITGASSGLGREMACRLLARGDRVVATVRREEALADLEQQYDGTLTVLKLDVTDFARTRSVMDDAFAQAGRIDVVVSNAAYGLFGAAEELTDEQIEHQIAANLTGSIQLIRAALPHLRRQGGGRVVQVSSEGGQMAYPNFSLYHATKWGIEGFVESVAQEVAPFGIDFIIAEPGPTATNFGASLVRPAAMAVYDDTPAGEVRRAVDNGSFDIRGDATRTVDAIIAAADSETPALRLTLGSTAYESMSKALGNRLASLQAQRGIALSADRDE
ncbi:SDR family oxidoreductase [Rhodovibrio salinarum]|uniref:Short-chain dehydrogenase/reductase n=1 Tax=Rhodovibrio salinarum TaxID=1087 RepID=A0A934QKX0_9PROT|nr:SDR family oxidoreductase [Rhodovibrio salinarum]MBK1698827.1 short-chain dehydrogenase/reductase [Rhodovibrio salinarum]